MMPDASPFWQNAFLVGVFVVFGWFVWNGWRLGVIRMLWSILAMSAACVVGMVAGLVVGGLALAVSPMASTMAGMAAGALAMLVVYIAGSFVGGLLFKRTSQQPTSVLRLGMGLGGAAIGLVFGLFTLWAALLFVRGMGGICEGTIANANGMYSLPLPEPVARTLVKLKKSVEAGDTGRIFESVDVMPREFYWMMDKFGKLVADPEAMRRFIAYPEVHEVLADPQFLALIRDPEIQEIVRSHDSGSLMSHPKMLQAVKDTGLLAKLQKIDINKALDYALAKPAATPAMEPAQPTQ